MPLYGWLFRRVLRLDMDGAGPPWPLAVHNPASGNYESVGGTGQAGSPLVLPGDPPDFVTTEDGDLIMVEGMNG